MQCCCLAISCHPQIYIPVCGWGGGGGGRGGLWKLFPFKALILVVSPLIKVSVSGVGMQVSGKEAVFVLCVVCE